MPRSFDHWIGPLAVALCIELMCCVSVAAGASLVSSGEIGFCKPYTWLFGEWVTPPRLPLLADINGDGYVDFLYASPREKLIDVSLNGCGLKPVRGQRFLSDLPGAVLSMCTGQLWGGKSAIVALGIDGTLALAVCDEKANHPAINLCRVDGVDGSGWSLAGKLSPTDKGDLAVVTPDGSIRVVSSETGKVVRELCVSDGVINAVAGDSDGDGQMELVLQTKQAVTLYRLDEKARKLASLRSPKGQLALAVGDVNADQKADMLVNGRVFLGPSFRDSVCVDGWKSFSRPVVAFLADVNGDGRADVVIQHKGSDYYGSFETDCDVYLTYFKSDSDWDDDGLSNEDEERLGTDPFDRDTDCDGLLDGWEVHGFANFDFPGMGASPLHKDIFVINQPTNGCPPDQVEQYMKGTVVPFFAKLPYKNLDGTDGFAIHFTAMAPVSVEQIKGSDWRQLADELFPADCIGSWHWMQISSMCGGGQSGLLADAGSTGMGSWIHEFGHQLGLTHSGKWGASSPTYTSLMNYDYCDKFNGRTVNVHFSNGELAGLILNEQHLTERISCNHEKLRHLSGIPYEFQMKALGSNETWIDWNWNGIFEDKPVKADINWGGGVDVGPAFNPSGRPADVNGGFDHYTDFTPELVVHNEDLYYLVINRPPLNPGHPRPGSGPLMMYGYHGDHSFGAATAVDAAATNDPSAVSDGRILYVFYPTADGVMYRFGQPDTLSVPVLIPDSVGLCVRAFVWRSRVYLLLYSGPDKSLRYRSVSQDTLGPVQDLGVKSTIPPGAAIDTVHDHLLLGTAQTQGDESYRWQLWRFAWNSNAGAFKQVSREWLGGDKSGWRGNRRPSLIFDAGPDAGPGGRVFFFGRGMAESLTGMTNVFMAESTAYQDYCGGWLLKRIGDPWCKSRLSPSVAWLDGDIILARTWGSDTALTDGGVYLCYKGTGAKDVDMADFDDVSLMANYGIARSISSFAQMPMKARKSRVCGGEQQLRDGGCDEGR